MQYSHEVEEMICVAKGAKHNPAPIPEEGKWVPSKEIKDVSGLTHGVGWCAPQQGTCKLTLNVKEGIIQEALVETIRHDPFGCNGGGGSAGKNDFRGAEYRPCLRCNQCSYEGTVPSNRLRPYANRFF